MSTQTTVEDTAIPIVKYQGLNTNKPVTVRAKTALTSGGDTVAMLQATTTPLTSPAIFIGSGAPTITAPQGSLYLRSDGSSISTRLYVNTTGSTTWTNVATGA